MEYIVLVIVMNMEGAVVNCEGKFSKVHFLRYAYSDPRTTSEVIVWN